MERWITCPHCGNGFYSVNKPKCSHCKQEISIRKYAVDDDIVVDLNPILALLRNGQDHDARWAFRQQIGLKTLTSDEVSKHIQHIKVEYLRQMPYDARPYLERQKRTITKQDVIDIIGGLSFLIAVLAFIPAVICLTNEGLAFLSIIYLIFPVMTIIWFKLPSKYSRPKPKKPKENCCRRCGTVYPLTATKCPTCGLTVKENNDRINKVKKP